MKTKKSDILLCVLFCGFLGTMLALFLLLPRQDFSEKEKRELAQPPVLSWESLLSGDFGEAAEAYLADHVPGRDFFVGLSAYYDLLSNRQVTKDVYPAGQDRLVEAPIAWNEAAARKNMEKINAFAQTLGQPVDLLLVPSAGYICRNQVRGLSAPYEDRQMIHNIYAMAQSGVTGLDLTDVFDGAQNSQSLYYRTDHHWTSRGAYTAYRAYMEQKGRQYLLPEDFSVTSYEGFYGSTYSRSGLWLTKPESIALWDSGGQFSVTSSESEQVHKGLFYTQRLEELDKYTVYLNGNQPLVRIRNTEGTGEGKLLVIRDSYANCLGTFLANSYEEVVLVDLRYYKKPISELAAAEGFDHVLVCYSLSNFMSDANIIWLR